MLPIKTNRAPYFFLMDYFSHQRSALRLESSGRKMMIMKILALEHQQHLAISRPKIGDAACGFDVEKLRRRAREKTTELLP